MICSKCGQFMVRLADGTYDCGCPIDDEDMHDYPGLMQGEPGGKEG